MASSVVLRRYLVDITKCPICLDVFDTPTSLPCLHTFCLRCLLQTFSADCPGDVAACPVCRRDFKVPAGGLAALPRNFTLDSIADLCAVNHRSLSSPTTVSVSQTVDSASNDKSFEIVNKAKSDIRTGKDAAEATSVHDDDDDDDCVKCSSTTLSCHYLHHQSSAASSENAATLTTSGNKHSHVDPVEFCFDCRVDICAACCADDHQRHRRRRKSDVTAECRRRVSAELERVSGALEAINGALVDVGQRRANTLDQVRQKETVTREGCRPEDDAEIVKLLCELSMEKDDALQQLAMHREHLEVDQISLKTFLDESFRRLMAASTTAGLLRIVIDVKIEAKTLLTANQLAPLDKSDADKKQQTSLSGTLNLSTPLQYYMGAWASLKLA